MTTWNGSRADELLGLPEHRFTANHSRSLCPRKCYLTGKNLFFKPSVIVTETIHGPGTPVTVVRWVTPKAYTLLVLSGFRATEYD